LNKTFAHARSFSSYSKKDLSMSSRKGINMSTLQIKANAISEGQLLESEEYFEQGKVFLSDKQYK